MSPRAAHAAALALMAAHGAHAGDAPHAGADDDPCRSHSVEGVAWLVPTEFGTHMEVRDEEGSQVGTVYSFFRIHHADDPGATMAMWRADGRRARHCTRHSDLAVSGGMTDRDFAMGAAVEAWAAEARPSGARDLPAALVDRGLSSGYYATREAAHGVLCRMGVRAAPALAAGLASADAEVRLRCGLILAEIRDGKKGE